MKGCLAVIIVIGNLLLSTAVFADHPGTLCYATNGRQAANWSWKSCAFNLNDATTYAQNHAMSACQNSQSTFNPATCHITSCVTVNCPDSNGPGPVAAGAQFSCTAYGQYGHAWPGTGANINLALQNALAVCQSNGGVNCHADASTCTAQ